MRKLLLGSLAGVLMVLSYFGSVQAAPVAEGEDARNSHGQCTAYFNGQKKGHGGGEDQTNQPTAFQRLQATGEEHTNTDGEDNDGNQGFDETNPPEHTDLTDAENIYNYCSDGDYIGGNMDHGRFSCYDQESEDPEDWTRQGTDTASNPECGENEDPNAAPNGKKP